VNLYHLSDLTIYAISFYASANLVHLLEFKYLACSTSFERRDVSFGWFCGGLFVAQKNIPHDISVPKKGDTYPKINIPNDYEAYPAVLLADCIQLSSGRSEPAFANRKPVVPSLVATRQPLHCPPFARAMSPAKQ